MLVSLRWLKDYVEMDLGPEALAERLTMAGLEVDAVTQAGPAFTNVVVAKILAVKPHPGADKLFLCDVTDGETTWPIVCGAPNTRAGILSPLARVGATIPGGYTIKSSVIRGERSEGMLCSEEELGIGPDTSGILVLPEDLPLGLDLADALDLKDTVLDISITPNRADCLSIVGIAREVAALTGRPLRYPEIRIAEAPRAAADVTSVTILDPDLCPRYTARVIEGVTIGPSPRWMRQRLEAVGLRSINNIVDITNFVMMELGQPLHAFDFRFLEEGRIVVRRSTEGEPFISLDEKERILKADTLMICDGRKPVAIAGIMGGLNSEVKEDTAMILLESAYFAPSSIRRSSRTLGMGTDAAFRFERGIDPEGVVRAADRAAQLMAELGGGQVLQGIIDCYPQTVPVAKDIPLRLERINDILGTEVPAEAAAGILKALGMEVRGEADGTWRVTPPTYRVDVTREIDLIEEVARLWGYDHVPTTLPSAAAAPVRKAPKEHAADRIREVLTGAGYTELVNYSFISQTAPDWLGLAADDPRRRLVRISNPLTEDQSVMQTTLIWGLIQTMARNVRAGAGDLKLFEIGRLFFAGAAGELPVERDSIACLLTGLRYDDQWHHPDVRVDFYDLKGVLEGLFRALKIDGIRFDSANPEPFLHPGRACRIFVGGQAAGILGEVHPDLLERIDVKGRTVVCELDLDALTAATRAVSAFRGVSRFPAVARDVAFLVPRELESEALLGHIRETGEELLEKVQIFDVYDGERIEPGFKSLGLRFSYRKADKTLTDEEVQQVHTALVARVVERTGARVRGES
ncbi:MAG: phenylalanine--tRNA ligase subunit beta [Syntrophales bacterium]|nr:phenylalanine--tRNA ligase subunit beta [Syntrophales bacterium]HOG08037.1 phenylalanine--tRNA ligase subunit beta [Syntrophales bacterium]HOS76875.1 phenylalanine--tRNA ligase subunit beta [Syntrophales bacterium]HPB70706.1 phenylalanine--tRNA ligase subunit beta [Syntrophales bacterium]HQP28566.1 phenylalanine--tRNA ligase subunit beta [Syntrophales bacterium]